MRDGGDGRERIIVLPAAANGLRLFPCAEVRIERIAEVVMAAIGLGVGPDGRAEERQAQGAFSCVIAVLRLVEHAQAVDSAALARARTMADALAASVQPPLTVDHALDFLHTELSKEKEPILERIEREMIKRVIVAEEGNILKASERLGITRATLRKRIDELGLKI